MFGSEIGRRTRHRIFGLAAGATIALAVAACGSSSGSSSGGSGTAEASSTLTIAATTAPLSLDPTLSSNDVPQAWFTNLAYEPLIERQPDGKVTPGLATSWGYSTDRLSFYLNLRKGVRFSDGTQLTAQNVVNWLKRYKAKGELTQWMANVTQVTATGPLQVTLKLSSPTPLFEYAFDQDGIAGDVVGSKGLADPSSLGSSTDGAGPYMVDVKDTILNSQYVYVKNPHYYDPSSQHYSKVVVKVISEENSILSAMRDGEVEVAKGSATNAPTAKSDGLRIEASPYAMVGVYIGDMDGKIVPALKNVKVREALSYAVDRIGITKSLYGNYGKATDQAVPEGMIGHVASLEGKFPYDPAKAKQLLAQAGYPNGFNMVLLEQPSIDSGDALAQALVADWKAIGVNVAIKTTPSLSAYATMLLSGKYPLTTFSFPYFSELAEASELINDPGLYNYLGVKDPTALSLIANQNKYDVDSPEGTKAAEASESYMTENDNIIAVSSIDALVFSTNAVSGISFGMYPWSDPVGWKPAR
jgi:peptide/nickel transport system substrate-binding protein